MSQLKEKLLEILSQSNAEEDKLRLQVAETLLRPDQPLKMTYEEFLNWADEDTLAEWVDGGVIMTSPASKRHQKTGSFVGQMVDQYVRHKKLGEVLFPPFQMKLLRTGRDPDLIFVANENLSRLKENYLDGPADLALEIVSKESAGRDRGDKFYEYEEAGIPEYWLIDPMVKRAEFYRLSPESRYFLAPVDSQGIYRSAKLAGFWLKLDWLWQDPPPAVEDVLLEVAGESYARALIDKLRQRGFIP
ncbi:MAG: Uma2 family endonuclease [Planctomycetes bacterium]|nr:Uma2 family endonuclease [Planctomycetota bacterium]